MLSEFRHTLRSLARAPGFSAAFIGTLALGLGASTAVFSLAEGSLFPTLHVGHPESLVMVDQFDKRRNQPAYPYALEVMTWREQARSFEGFATLTMESNNLIIQEDPRVVFLGLVPADYFQLLEVLPWMGRTFMPGEDEPGANRVIIITHQAWKNWFAGDADILGKEVRLNGEGCRVIGVLEPGYRGVDRHNSAEIYRPRKLVLDPSRPTGSGALRTLGRLKPGVTPSQAQAELTLIKMPVPAARQSRLLADRTPLVSPVGMTINDRTRRIHAIYVGVVSLLYAIALASAMNLMLARSVGRRRELGIRLAVGGSRWQVARMLVIESLLLNLLAGALGLLVAKWIFPVLFTLTAGNEDTLAAGITLSRKTLVFASVASLLSGLIIALFTAWRAMRADLRDALQEGAMIVGDSRRLRMVRGSLIVFQTTLAVVLLTGTGLLLKSVHRLQTVDLGYALDGRYEVSTTILSSKPLESVQRQAMQRQIIETLQAQPGVSSVATKTLLNTGMAGTMTLPDRADLGELPVLTATVTDDLRAMIDIPLLAGRDLGAFRPGAPPVALVNNTFAKRYFKSAPAAVGRRILVKVFSNEIREMEIVGVLDDLFPGDPRRAVEPIMYIAPEAAWVTFGINSYIVRVPGQPPPGFLASIKRALYQISPHLGVLSVNPLEKEARYYAARERGTAALLQAVSLLSLLLTVLGIFSVMAYTVARQRSEFGLRLTLGATPALLFQLVLERGLKLALIGIVLGSGSAWALSRFIQSMLYETQPYDPLVYASVALVLLLTALLACWWPARRAMSATPAELLRVS